MKVILVILILAFVGLYVILGMLRRITRMFMGEEPRQQQRTQSTHREKGGLNKKESNFERRGRVRGL